MNQSSAKTPLVVLLLVAALFLAMNQIAQSAPLESWWLVVVLLLLALLLALPERFLRFWQSTPETSMTAPTTPLTSDRHVYVTPSPKAVIPSEDEEVEADYGRSRGTEARADAMASAAHMETVEALENEGMVQNVMAVGATGTHDEVDEIAGAPVKSLDRTATQEMRIASAKPDDLKRVDGIGPKMAAALNAYGIMTFTQLASATLPDLETAVQDAGMRFAPSMSTWSEQAAYAARGDWEGLKAFQSTLTGGRKT